MVRSGQVLRGVAAEWGEGAVQHDLLRAALPALTRESQRRHRWHRLSDAGERPAARDLHAGGAAGAGPAAREWGGALHNTDVPAKCDGHSEGTARGIAQGPNGNYHLHDEMIQIITQYPAMLSKLNLELNFNGTNELVPSSLEADDKTTPLSVSAKETFRERIRERLRSL